MAGLDGTCIDCACGVCSRIRLTVDQIFSVLSVYGWILDSYVVDNLWQKLPDSWRRIVDETSPEELGKWILGESERQKVWPLSLLALRSFTARAQVSRDHDADRGLECIGTRDARSAPAPAPAGTDRVQVSPIHGRFNNLFAKHVKGKKRHEIDAMSKVAAECARKSGCECVVDVGSGMGHLARLLAYRHGLRLACVEQNSELLGGARKWDAELASSLAKHIPDFYAREPRHLPLRVGSSSAARAELAGQLKRAFADGFGLVGLHPCGDLAASLLRFYSTERSARFICIVGCCYMKLTLRGQTERGYPLSGYLQSRMYSSDLSYAALEVACHAVEKHCDKLKTNNFSDLIVHSYRAALECLLVERNANLRHTQLRNTKIKDEKTTFKEYCAAATEDLNAEDRPTEFDLERSDVKDNLDQWKRVVAFGSLRLLLAPLVETIVLLDRFLFLSELKLSPSLKAKFDARVSPRNFLLVSTKED